MANSFAYPQQRFGLYGFCYASYWPGPEGPTIFHVKDAEQRRVIHISVPVEVNEVEELDEDFFPDVVAPRYADNLDPDTTQINVSPDGALLSMSTDYKHETSLAVLGSPLDMLPAEWAACKTPRAKLIEVQRIINCVDLVSYADPPPGSPKTAVFKYQWDGDRSGLFWDELNCWIRVSGHPNIVPVERIITEHSHLPSLGDRDVVVGLTSTFIGGGILRGKHNRVFKLEHLKQLLRVIDDLNLKYGIAHQDIATYNMFLDPSSDCLKIFDFNCSARIGKMRMDPKHPDYYHGSCFDSLQSDLKGAVFALHEIITGDVRHPRLEWGPGFPEVLDREWVQDPEVTLDCDLLEYRKTLCEWIRWREQPENTINHYTEAPEYIDWPAPYVPMLPEEDGGEDDTKLRPYPFLTPAKCKSRGVDFIEWKRPAGHKIPDGYCVL